MTGVPGWLAQAFLDDVTANGLDEISDVRAIVHPSALPGASALGQRNPIVTTVHAHDLGNTGESPANLNGALKGVDAVVHGAAVIHVNRTRDWYRINTEGTIRLAHAAREANVRRFVFVSSNAAGGRCESATQVLTEADRPKPLSHYGKSKWLAEQELMRMHKPGQFEVAILRPSMFYGPPVPDRHVDVYQRILSGRMPMVGNGEYRRSITYIDHLVQATRLAITHPAASGETFYVVDEPVYTTRSITEGMATALGVPLKTLPLPAIAGPVAHLTDDLLAACGLYWQNMHLLGESHWHVALSCQKLKQRLGYNPTVSLAEGMKRAVDWCRAQGKLPAER